jgi:glycosyltransferase involved in cell wall biosynthesis
MAKRILFLSTIDYSGSGIQVTKKTPEYFASMGWMVHCLIIRDESCQGSFHYQPAENPKNVKVTRARMPMFRPFERIKNFNFIRIYSKLRNILAVFKLIAIGAKILRRCKFDILYGSGPQGVLASHVLKYFSPNVTIVSRFYGTFLAAKVRDRKYIWLALDIDEIIAFALPCDLMIITNDGTRGEAAVRYANPSNLKRLKFWVNGVDLVQQIDIDNRKCDGTTICRLVNWKRVDRVIECVNLIVNKHNLTSYRHHIIGAGASEEELKELSHKYGLERNIIFHGSLAHDAALEIMANCQIYISTYDLSNVGNPLLEAIRCRELIFTLDNGDTGKWIHHRMNGFIYTIDKTTIDRMARDVVEVIGNEALRRTILENLDSTAREKLWTWDQRLQAEYEAIDCL